MKLGFIVLPVGDALASRDFYEKRLGLRVREVHEDTHRVVLDTGTGVCLCLQEMPREGLVGAGGGGSFPVLLVENAAALRESLLQDEVPCTPLEDQAAWRRFSADDPDGNRLEFVEPARAACAAFAARGPHVASDMTVAFSADQPGTLARALEALTEAGLDTPGYAEIEGYFHLLVPEAASARHAFEQAGFTVQGDQPVVVVDLSTHSGSTADLFRKVADAGVNVSFTYATADGRLAIGSPEIDRLIEVLDLDANSIVRLPE